MYYYKNYNSTNNIIYLDYYSEIKQKLIKLGYDILPLDI